MNHYNVPFVAAMALNKGYAEQQKIVALRQAPCFKMLFLQIDSLSQKEFSEKIKVCHCL